MLRGGRYENLTKYLLVNNTGVSVVGGSTASFSGAVTTGALTVTGAITQTNSIGTVLGQLGNTGQNCFSGGSGYTAANGATLWMFGASHATFPGQAQFYPGTNVGGSLNFYDRALLRQLIVNESGLTLQNQCRIIYGSAGTTTASNNEIVGTSTGPVTNAPSGSTVRTTIAGTTVLTVSNTTLSAAGTGGIDANLYTLGTSGTLPGNTVRYIYGHSSVGAILNVPTGQGWSFRANGSTIHTLSDTGASWGGTHDWNSGAAQVRITSTGLVLNAGLGTASLTMGSGNIVGSTTGTILGNLVMRAGAPATATSTGTAGQIAWDASGNIYICSATNTWRRVATSTF